MIRTTMESINNSTSTSLGGETRDQEQEMSMGTMIITGISCGILFCIFFSLCAERFDFFITKKLLGGEEVRRNYLQDDGGSSNFSDLVHGWDSESDDSSSDESNARVRYITWYFQWYCLSSVICPLTFSKNFLFLGEWILDKCHGTRTHSV